MAASYLTSSQLKKLTEHKYSAEGSTFLDPYMQKFWRWLVEQLPLWWAPNAMTLAGLIINVVTTFILMYYSPDGKQEVSHSFVAHTRPTPNQLMSDLLSRT